MSAEFFFFFFFFFLRLHMARRGRGRIREYRSNMTLPCSRSVCVIACAEEERREGVCIRGEEKREEENRG